MTRNGSFLTFLSLSIAAVPPVAHAQAERIDSVRLVAPQVSMDYPYGGDTVYRVAIFHGTTADTLRSVVVSQRPTLVANSSLFGFLADSGGRAVAGFIYRAGHLTTLRLPADLDQEGTRVAISPDGHHLAYVRFDDDGARGTVVSWPDCKTVVVTPAVQIPAGDVMRGAAKWLDATRFELYIDPSYDGRTAVRFQGRVGGSLSPPDTVTF